MDYFSLSVEVRLDLGLILANCGVGRVLETAIHKYGILTEENKMKDGAQLIQSLRREFDL